MNQRLPVIVVVEDDPDIAQLLTTLSPMASYAVVVTRTGTVAIDQVHQYTLDLILSDFHLPQGNGWSSYHHLRAQPRYHALPCIFLSATPPMDLRADDPFLCLVAKPFEPPALFACMRSLLHLVERQAQCRMLGSSMHSAHTIEHPY